MKAKIVLCLISSILPSAKPFSASIVLAFVRLTFLENLKQRKGYPFPSLCGLFQQGGPSIEQNIFLVKEITTFQISRCLLQKTVVFKARQAEEYMSKDVMVYEEMALISGFQRPVICLLGAPGVGRQTLRDMLIEADPDRYELAIPCKTCNILSARYSIVKYGVYFLRN